MYRQYVVDKLSALEAEKQAQGLDAFALLRTNGRIAMLRESLAEYDDLVARGFTINGMTSGDRPVWLVAAP